jgi:NAD(P)-dependent dehydrogenase (short-subunit alcohol dehydrogenase family)
MADNFWSMTQLAGKTVLLTGGTGAIGAEVARLVASAGAEVILWCRTPERGRAVLGEPALAGRHEVGQVDLASLREVAQAARDLRQRRARLDAVLACAGIWSRQRRASADGYELTFAVNHLATFALVTELLPLLRQSRARVVTVSSGLHVRGRMAWDDLMQAQGGFNGVRAYEQSKLANVMFALALARRSGAAPSSVAMHPGVVRSALTREYPELWRQPPPGQVAARAAAAAICRVAFAPEHAKVSGRYFDGDRPRAAGRAALEVAAQDRLWRESEELVVRALAAATR